MELDPAEAFVRFDQQDSGCVSCGIEHGGRRLFVKTAVTEAGRGSLRRAVAFHRSVQHPAIAAPIDVVDGEDGPRLVYAWLDGVVLNQATVRGSDRAGLARFLGLPIAERLRALDTVLDAHLAVADAGFVSVDLYDGCFLYDFDRRSMHLIDLDEYRPGPFVLDGERLPGSTRYMAPEELVRGATIDERTTVFHLGRTASELLGASACSPEQASVIAGCTQAEPGRRIPSAEAMATAWRAAPTRRDR